MSKTVVKRPASRRPPSLVRGSLWFSGLTFLASILLVLSLLLAHALGWDTGVVILPGVDILRLLVCPLAELIGIAAFVFALCRSEGRLENLMMSGLAIVRPVVAFLIAWLVGWAVIDRRI